MRYTHYIAFLSDRKSKQQFSSFIDDVKRIIDNKPDGIDISGMDGVGAPVISSTQLIIGQKGFEDAYSALHIELDELWPAHRYPLKMVITEKQPYDIVICSCLLSLAHHFTKDVEITTDGQRKDWLSAIGLYEYTTERRSPDIYFRDDSRNGIYLKR